MLCMYVWYGMLLRIVVFSSLLFDKKTPVFSTFAATLTLFAAVILQFFLH